MPMLDAISVYDYDYLPPALSWKPHVTNLDKGEAKIKTNNQSENQEKTPTMKVKKRSFKPKM